MSQPDAIAFLVNGDEQYGVGTVVTTLSEGISGQGLRPIVLSLGEGSLVERCRECGWETEVLGVPSPPPFNRRPRTLLGSLLGQRSFFKQTRQSLRSHLLSHGTPPLVVQLPTHLMAAGSATRSLGGQCYWVMPNIVGDHWPLKINQRVYQWLIRHYGVTPLPNSRYTGRTLGPGYDSNAMHLGADSARFDPARVDGISRDLLGIPDKRVVFCIAARLHASKGQLVFWEALLRQIKQGEEVALLVVGGPTDGELAGQMRELAKEHHAEDRLIFTGWTTEPERYLGAADIAVNSRLDPEPFGLSVVEAMLMGKPILVHALGGPAETVLDGQTGWHVTEPTVDGFEEGILRVLADRERWGAMGRFAREHSVANYSTEAYAYRFLERVRGASKEDPTWST